MRHAGLTRRLQDGKPNPNTAGRPDVRRRGSCRRPQRLRRVSARGAVRRGRGTAAVTRRHQRVPDACDGGVRPV